MSGNVLVNVVCARGHTPNKLATFTPSLIPDGSDFWVGDPADLRIAPWHTWDLNVQHARGRETPTESRPNLYTEHDRSRAVKDGESWRFYCRRCRFAARIDDADLGDAVLSAARDESDTVDVTTMY